MLVMVTRKQRLFDRFAKPPRKSRNFSWKWLDHIVAEAAKFASNASTQRCRRRGYDLTLHSLSDLCYSLDDFSPQMGRYRYWPGLSLRVLIFHYSRLCVAGSSGWHCNSEVHTSGQAKVFGLEHNMEESLTINQSIITQAAPLFSIFFLQVTANTFLHGVGEWPYLWQAVAIE